MLPEIDPEMEIIYAQLTGDEDTRDTLIARLSPFERASFSVVLTTVQEQIDSYCAACGVPVPEDEGIWTAVNGSGLPPKLRHRECFIKWKPGAYGPPLPRTSSEDGASLASS